MSRLKVLFITTWYPTKEHPIGGVFIREHAKAAALYTDVVVLHHLGTKPDLKALWRIEEEIDCNLTGGIPTYRVWSRHLPIPLSSYLTYIWSVLKGFRYIVSKGFRADIIHAHVYEAGVPAILIGRLYGIPILITEHSTEFPRKLLRGIDIRKARFAFNRVDSVLPVSKSLQRAIGEYGIKARFQIVPNVVDVNLFYFDSSSRPRKLEKCLLTVALLDSSRKKGIPILFEALDRLYKKRKDWHLNIVGDGPARAEYERFATNLGLAKQITFHGMKPKSEVAVFMRQADLFVVPSLFETFSVVTAEALATGTPVLATNCGGPEEFVARESGLIVPPGNMEALFNGLDYMLNNLEKYNTERISRYATQCFSPQQVGAQLHRIYLECVGKYRT
jgi:glycosyltransferase involved in cell wall biosynthesis